MNFKFSIQQLLWATLAFVFLATAMSAAYQGNKIATGLLLAPLVMLITFAVLAAIYWPCYLISRLLHPPIRTSAPVNYSQTQPPTQNDSADSPDTSGIPAEAQANSTGAP